MFGGGGTGIENGLNLGPSVAGGMGVFVGGGGTDEERGGGERVAGEGAVAHCVVSRVMGEEETEIEGLVLVVASSIDEPGFVN